MQQQPSRDSGVASQGYQTQGSQGNLGVQSELTNNFEFTKTSPMDTVKTTNRVGSQQNLEKAYEELEREIYEIKSKLQQSLGASIHNEKHPQPNIPSPRQEHYSSSGYPHSQPPP